MPKFKLTITEVQKGFSIVEADDRDLALEMYLDEYNAGKITWTDSSITDFDVEEIIPVCGGCGEAVKPGGIIYEIPGGKYVCQDCIVKMDTHELLCFLGCKGRVIGREGDADGR